jgi:sugar phosphate isomerase/epimerase
VTGWSLEVPGTVDGQEVSHVKLSLAISAQATRYGDVAFVGDLERNIGRLAQMGYDGVELGIRDPQSMDASELEAMLTQHSMICPVISTGQAWIEERLSFTSPDSKVREAAIERIRQHIALAARMRTMVMLGLIRGKWTEGVAHEQAMAWLVEALQECASVSGHAGVRLVIEPINRFEADFIHSARDGMALLDRVGYDHVGLILDTFHMNIEEPSIEESIRLVGPRLYHFHLSDSNRWHPGAGHIDFARVVRTLAGMGYRGFLSGEFMAKPDAETAAQRMIEHMRPLLLEIG